MGRILDDYNMITSELDKVDIKGSDVAKAACDVMASPFKKLYNKITDSAGNIVSFGKDMSNGYDSDDNVFIPEGTKTLLGENFESLYASSELRSYDNSDGTKSSYIVSTSPYGTEMKSGNATANDAVSYDEKSSVKFKAIYEITLLSKKYGNMYIEGDDANNDLVETEYANYMSKYRSVCEQQGVDWDYVMTGVSAELQTQSAYYLDKTNDMFGSMGADENRILVNRAHSMVKGCMSEGYEDALIPALAGKLSYEDTLDTNPKEVGFLQNIGNKFVEMWNNVKENWPHPFRSIKETVTGYLGSVLVATDRQSEISDQRAAAQKEYINSMKEKGEQLVDKASDKVTEYAPKIRDKATEYGNKAYDAFGNIVDKVKNKDSQLEQ